MADEELPQEGENEETGEDGREEEAVIVDEGSDASEEDGISAESLASELGWSPKDKWRGDPDQWKPAADFLKTTVEINKVRGREIKTLNERLDRIARTSATLMDQALDKQRRELEDKYTQAVEEGDVAASRKIGQQIDALKAPDTPDAAVTDFVSRNASWWQVDPDASAIAFNAAQRQADAGKTTEEQLAAAEAAVRKRFPEYFEEQKPKGKQPATVETGGSRTANAPRKGPKGFNDLPPEARAAALDFEKRGRATKEEYAQLYWQENA